jgi:hypothetical protein
MSWSMAYKTAVGGAVTVGTTSTTILTAQARIYARITNLSANNIYLGLGNAAVASQGILLRQYDIFEINMLNPFYGTVYGIATAASSVLIVQS